MLFTSLLTAGAIGLGKAIEYGINKDTAANSARREFEYNRALQLQQHELNQQSLLESPSLQKEGLIRAGYNPMLALGNLSYPTTAGGHVSVESPEFSSGDVASTINEGMNSAKQRELMSKQKDLIDKQIANIEVNSSKAGAETLEALARAEKTRKEADSIDPDVIKENQKYGNGLVGESMRFTRTLKEGLGFGGSVDSRLGDIVPATSAKGSKVISDEQNKLEKIRGDKVRSRRKHH